MKIKRSQSFIVLAAVRKWKDTSYRHATVLDEGNRVKHSVSCYRILVQP